MELPCVKFVELLPSADFERVLHQLPCFLLISTKEVPAAIISIETVPEFLNLLFCIGFRVKGNGHEVNLFTEEALFLQVFLYLRKYQCRNRAYIRRLVK